MNEETLRDLVRQALARHQSGSPQPPASAAAPLAFLGHPSQYRYALPESDGPCIIEPGVACNHCGYCQSHGH
jgi:hypothetical protein